MTLLRMSKATRTVDPLLEWLSAGAREVLKEETFKRTIAIERKRTERSQKPFLLTLLEIANHQGSWENEKILERIVSSLLLTTRETDVVGWYKERTTVGVMFTDLAIADKNSILSAILGKVTTTLRDELTPDQFAQVSMSFHLFPDHWDHDQSGRPSNPALYPDMFGAHRSRQSLLGFKRMMDIGGGTLMLITCSPLLLAIALAIKASSKGPILFRQQRVGQYGKNFTFLKFRSMHTGNDHRVHQEYVTKFIASKADTGLPNGNGERVYKLANDKRVTPLGKFLRKTSLDELPQLLNVLNGDMSLVGPRPPIPYELAAYQTWHRRRVLEVKPGITGLWQVTGRSRVKFDEMVRLDLRYAASWSPLLDLKILMRTPLAVIKGTGAH
jgi:lipopolysaccharide/colanic/teichoic acid biosynthesis glycosyltransferase